MEEEERAAELEEIDEEERQRIVRDALGKFNVFLHVTAFLTGCAYLALLGVFVPETMPYIFIPMALWAAGLAYHFWRAWHSRDKTEEALKTLDETYKPVFTPEREFTEEEQALYQEGLKHFEEEPAADAEQAEEGAVYPGQDDESPV
jgi:hypothetical protein